MPLTVGTAGHIDHGKTWLVRALTGVDTDRLPEERRRGISIELGYARLDLPDGRRLSLIDVPGHERFVRTMVAGATGIDLFLLVIDANEGARPQTHEHLDVLRLLGVEHGVVALTKADAADAETLALAREEAEELVPGAEVVAVSARTGLGLDELRAALGRAAGRVSRRPALGSTRLYVDRVFTLSGIGTVVTGTLWAGTIGVGDTLRAEPAGLDVRVRSVEVHDEPVERAESGQRVEAVAARVHTRLDVALEELEPIPDGTRVDVLHGTRQIPARLVRAGGGYAQLRLSEPVLAARGDRLVLRAGRTLGGGRVLDPAPPRTRDPARLELLDRGDPASILRAVVRAPVTRAALLRRGLLAPVELEAGLTSLSRAGDWYFAAGWLDELRRETTERLARRAESSPLDPGLPLAELLPAEPWAADVIPLLDVERRGAKGYLPGTEASLGDKREAAGVLERRLADGDVVKVDDAAVAAYLESAGRLRRLGDGYAISSAGFERARDLLVEECRASGRITLARFRDLLGTGRRDTQLLLERFDADGLTRRVGDARVLRRTAGSG